MFHHLARQLLQKAAGREVLGLAEDHSGGNILFGPDLWNLDLSLHKVFALSERMRLQFRAESFNFTNTPAFGQPAATINSLGAGAITSAGDPRRIQFGLKFIL